VRALARKFGLVAKPRADRWHRKPTALFGGLAIFAAFLLSFFGFRPADSEGDALLITCASAMFVLGLADDIFGLKPYAKLIGQIIISAALTTFGMRLHWLPSPVMDQVLTIFWLVGITNAINLLDNLDGLAGGVVTIGAAYLVYFCHAAGQPSAAAMMAAVCGAVLGFLIFNFNPASIFMGDCGSLFLGFFLGGVTMVNNQGGIRRNIVAVLAVPVLLLLIPIIDTTMVTLTRKFNGRPISQGGRDHTSHRLVALGLSDRGAALVLWMLSAVSGGIAALVRVLALPLAVLLVPSFVLIVVFLLIFLGRVKVYEPVATETEGGGRALLPTLADFAYKRRIFEVLNDLVVVVLAYYAAFLLRFDGKLVEPFYHQLLQSMPVVIGVQVVSFLALGLYRGLWRYTSMSDVSTLIKAVAGGWLATIIALVLLTRLEGFSRGVLVMDGVLLAAGIAGTRIAFRLLRTQVARYQMPPGARRVLIYGAGDAGELLAREMQNNHELRLVPVGFLDDDPNKRGRMIHGLPVLGPLERLEDLAREEGVDQLVVSTNKIHPERVAILDAVAQLAHIQTRKMRIVLE
jgi:UDP-GlcNAc:undecaprenyl-phosphate GlcNAc-1-phosphate transferase